MENNIIERIKKLIALSEDSAATESEKLSALKHAQKLMLKYSISELSANTEAAPEIVEVPFTLERPIFYLTPDRLCVILGTIGEGFGCYSSFSRAGIVKLWGFKVNVQIVEYTTKVLLAQGVRDCNAGWKQNPSANYKMAFWEGFIIGLQDRFEKIKLSDEKGIAIYDKVKALFEERVTTATNISFTGSDAQAAQAGNKSAREAVVNAALGGTKSEGKKLL